MKILHTSDIHLDACFAGGGMPFGFGSKRRRQLRETFASVLRHAWTCNAEAVLVAGDLFEMDRVGRDTLAFLKDQLERLAPIPVLIAPGVHDPYVPESPYSVEDWPANVHIFNQSAWTAWESPETSLTVHGLAFTGPELPAGVFSQLRIPRDGRVHVALAHGAERSLLGSGNHCRGIFDLSDIAQPGLSYLALGQSHRMIPVRQDSGFQAWYPGAAEGLGFDDTSFTHMLEVDILFADTGSMAVVQVMPRVSSKVVHATVEIDCSGLADAEETALQAADRLPHGGAVVIGRIILSGVVAQEFRESLKGLPELLQDRFEALSIEDRTIISDDYSAIAREDTALGEFVRQLGEEHGDAIDAARRMLLARSREMGVSAFLGRELPTSRMEGPLP